MRCKNCELEHTIDNNEGSGCLIIGEDGITEDRNGEYGCRFNRAKIKKEIKHFYNFIIPESAKQMGDLANFKKETANEKVSK